MNMHFGTGFEDILQTGRYVPDDKISSVEENLGKQSTGTMSFVMWNKGYKHRRFAKMVR